MNERLECAPVLERSVRDGRWTPATSVDEYLVVHGGLHPILAQHLDGPQTGDAAQFATALRAAFERRVSSGVRDPLFVVTDGLDVDEVTHGARIRVVAEIR